MCDFLMTKDLLSNNKYKVAVYLKLKDGELKTMMDFKGVWRE